MWSASLHFIRFICRFRHEMSGRLSFGYFQHGVGKLPLPFSAWVGGVGDPVAVHNELTRYFTRLHLGSGHPHIALTRQAGGLSTSHTYHCF